MTSLLRFLDLRAEERRNTFAAFATLLAITSGHTLLETARDALFLSKVPASQLPWMYLVIVVLALGLAQIRKADTKAAIVSVLVAAAGLTAAFWVLAHDLVGRRWVLYALYVWSGLFASWVTVQFWTLLGRAHTMTQAKRLYGFIGAGSVLGGVVGAFSARIALTFVGPRAMLLASAALFVVAAAPVLMLRAPVAAEAGRDEAAAASMVSGGKLLWQNPFARSILGIVLLATISFTLTDFLFKARIAQEFSSTRELAAWLSTFNAVTNTVSLVAQLLIGPWIFRTFGVQRALFFFPILLLFAAGSVLATAGRLGAAVLMKGFDGTLRYSVHKTSTELLLVPVPDGTRERIKPTIELVGTRGGQAVASVLILFLVAIGARGSITLTVASFVVVLTVAWLAIVVRIRGHYLDVFRETLRAGGLSGKTEIPDLDIGALEMLFAGLNSSRDIEVLASLELLAEQHRERLIPALILYHPGRDVVLRALEIFTRRGRADFVSIADRLNAHPDREVAAAALRARTAVAPDRQLLEERLVDPCSQVSATALIALMARGWIDADEADRRLRAVIAGRSWQTAAELARAIRDIASDPASEPKELRDRFDELLVRLAREAGTFKDVACTPSGAVDLQQAAGGTDAAGPGRMRAVPLGGTEQAPEVRVRLEVARAMAARRGPAFLPILVGMLNRHELRATARAAIAAIPGALDFIDDVMRQHDFARDVRVHLPRTMILFEAEPAARKLMSHLLVEKDGAVRFKVLRALVKLRRKVPELALDGDILLRAAERILDHAEELRRWGVGLVVESKTGPTSAPGLDSLRAAHHLLIDLIHDKECHAVQRLFMLLGLVHREDFEDVERGLRSSNPKTRANSLELVENLVRAPLRARVLALVGEQDVAAPTAQTMSYEDVIREVLVKGSTTMRTLAEYRALELGIDTTGLIGARPSQPPTIESIGKRLVDRARDLLVPTPNHAVSPTRATRAPA